MNEYEGLVESYCQEKNRSSQRKASPSAAWFTATRALTDLY